MIPYERYMQMLSDPTRTRSASGFEDGDEVWVSGRYTTFYPRGWGIVGNSANDRPRVHLPDGSDFWYIDASDLTLKRRACEGVEVPPAAQKERSLMQRLTARLKRVLNKDLQAIYRVGWINGDLELTRDGSRALLEVLLDANEAQLAEVARERIEELESEE